MVRHHHPIIRRPILIQIRMVAAHTINEIGAMTGLKKFEFFKLKNCLNFVSLNKFSSNLYLEIVVRIGEIIEDL